MREGRCRECGETFEVAVRGPVPERCPEHRDEHRRKLARRRLERWAAREALAILRQAIEKPG
jgi:hypothetical protein